MSQLSARPVSTYFGFACPICATLPPAASEPGKCQCGYVYPRTYVVPYDAPWSFDEPFLAEFREHRALRLLGRFVGKDPGRLRELSHVEYLAISRYPSFEFAMLRDFSALRTLELDFLRLGTLDGIEHLQLTMLGLTELRQLVDVSALKGMSILLLQVALCNRVKNYDPLGDLRNLTRFDLEAKSVPSLAFLRRLGYLRRLGLAVDKADSDVLADVAELAGLTWLGIRRRLVGAPGLTKLRQLLPACTIEVW